MKFSSFCNAHSPEILTGFGIAGMILSVAMAIVATPKATKKLEEKKEELKVEKLGVVETVKTAGPCYIGTGICMALSGFSMVKATDISLSRNSLLAAGLIMSETARKQFEEATKEVVGEKKVNEIRDEIAKEQLEKHPVRNSEVIVTGKGKALIYEPLVMKYFEMDIDELKKIELDALKDVNNFMTLSVREWVTMLGIDARKLDPAVGDLVWGPNTGFELYHSFQEADDGRPCCVITHLTPPKDRSMAA